MVRYITYKHAIVTSMTYRHSGGRIPYQYVCWGPNTNATTWLKNKDNQRLHRQLIIIYGINIFADNGWRDATCSLRLLQKAIKRRYDIRRRYRVLLYLSKTKLNTNVKRLITNY
jgi:hypothetical protein